MSTTDLSITDLKNVIRDFYNKDKYYYKEQIKYAHKKYRKLGGRLSIKQIAQTKRM